MTAASKSAGPLRALRRPGTLIWGEKQQTLRSIAAAAVALLAALTFFQVRNLVEAAANAAWGADAAPWLFGVALLAGFLFIRVRYDEFDRVLVTMTRVTAIGVVVYLVVEPPVFTLVVPESAPAHSFVSYGYWAALSAAAGAIWRPSLLYAAALYVMLTRFIVDDISGFRLSQLDVRYIMEMAQFLSVSACAIALIHNARSYLPASVHAVCDMIERRRLELCIAFVAIGLHFGNYFWSGVAKLVIGPWPWSWVLENNTENMILGALVRGVTPIGAWPGLVEALFVGFGSVVVLSNLFVLLFQLSSIVAVLRTAWIKVISLIFDVFHIGIYVVGGLFFWPWVWNNVTILWAVRNSDDRSVGWAPKLCCIAIILMGGSAELGRSAWLAWFDATDIKVPIVQARTGEDAPWVTVPVAFFMSHSYSVSHGYLDLARTEDHYRPSIWGSVRTYEPHRMSGICPEPAHIENPEPAERRAERVARVKAFLRVHHATMLERAGEDGWYNFYLRSHHHPSNPLLHSDFNAIDLRDIASYRLLTRSVCLSLEDGELKQRVVKDEEIVVDVEG